MYLSRLILNPRHRDVQRDIADCQQLHRTVMALFPAAGAGDPRAALGVLFRLDAGQQNGRLSLLVQSSVAPDWTRLPPGYLADTEGEPPNPACKSVAAQYAGLAAGTRLAFRLRANPTRKIDTRSGPDGQRRHGRRVELRAEQDQLAWLRRKGEECGFALVQARARPAPLGVAPPGKQTGTRESAGEGAGLRQRLTFAAILFEGELVITDAERFRAALARGIGPGKAYGFGLLSVAPAGG